MTDNEIIKALNGNILNAKSVDCKVWSIEVYKLENALDLINRQQAEIDRYKGVIKILEMDVAAAEIRGAKDFGKYLIDKSIKGFLHAGDIVDYCYDFAHEVTKIEQVEGTDI